MSPMSRSVRTPMLGYVAIVAGGAATHALSSRAAAAPDLYAPVLGRSVAIDDLFLRMQTAVRRELTFENELFKLQGCLDLILSSAQ